MLKLENFDVDESLVVRIGTDKYIIDFIPALVDVLLLQALNDKNVEVAFYHLFKNTDLDIDKIPPIEKIKILRNLRHNDDPASEKKKDNSETHVDLTQLLGFLSLHIPKSKFELLTQYTLIELFSLTNMIKAKNGYESLPFFETYKVASIKDFARLL